MKILLAPLITKEKTGTQYLLCRSLAALLTKNGHTCAISTSAANSLKNASLYEMPGLRKPLFAEKGRSYEEWLYSCGAGSENWLSADTDSLLQAADEFKCDLIINMDRISALIVSRLRNIPCLSFVSSPVFRSVPFPVKAMRGTNAVLSRYHLEQVFTLGDLYRERGGLLTFGTPQMQVFPEGIEVTRLGIPSLTPQKVPRTNRVMILLSETGRSPSYLRRIIREAFAGAPYAVFARIPGIEPAKEDNLRFIDSPRTDLLTDSIACIHDGSRYFYHQCAASGIVQLIVSDHSYPRIYTAQEAQRAGCGLFLYEEELTMSNLYESYRRLLSDDRYDINAQRLREQVTALGDLTEILKKL